MGMDARMGMGDLGGSRLVEGAKYRARLRFFGAAARVGEGETRRRPEKIEPGTRFRRRAPTRLIGELEIRSGENGETGGDDPPHTVRPRTLLRVPGQRRSRAWTAEVRCRADARVPSEEPRTSKATEAPSIDQDRKRPPRWQRAEQQVRRERCAAGPPRQGPHPHQNTRNASARGEVKGEDSACETRSRDARPHASNSHATARSRTPSAAPVEAAGAATETEHASASERGAGGDPNEIQRVAGRELRSRHDTRGEVKGGDSACETRSRDVRTTESRARTNARSRTPTAAPVEAAGAATETEHASASERGAGGDPNEIQRVAGCVRSTQHDARSRSRDRSRTPERSEACRRSRHKQQRARSALTGIP